MEEGARRRLVFTNSLLFETPGGLRFTQDSPILPNVWLAFAAEPHRQHELILTNNENGGTGRSAHLIREMLNNYRIKKGEAGKDLGKRPRISYIPGQIAARLYFDELMRVVLPLTRWWHETYDQLRVLQHTMPEDVDVADWFHFPQPDPEQRREQDLFDALMMMRRDIDPSHANGRVAQDNKKRQEYIRNIPSDLSWFVRIGGLIANCFQNGHLLLDDRDTLGKLFEKEFSYRRRERMDPDLIENSTEMLEREKRSAVSLQEAQNARRQVVAALTNLYWDWNKSDDYPSEKLIWRVTKNRPIRLAVNKSVLTVKADAAIRLFDISCKTITWAVVDSGIDSTHQAFKTVTPEYEKEVRGRLELERQKAEEAGAQPAREAGELRLADLKKSRVVKTLDFTRLRELLDCDIEIDENDAVADEQRRRVLDEMVRRMPGKDHDDKVRAGKNLLEELKRRIKDGKDISWQDLEDAIVDHQPEVPMNDHGTHVAGILGADWIDDLEHERKEPLHSRTRRMQGVCPDINLIDVRVFRDDGLTDEFELLAAIQYLRWMNSRAGTMQVHGANLSLSLIHEVRRFACGRTPICDECNEAVAAGMVVVAAAGNRGFEMSDVEEVSSTDNYRSVSITDPGNATGVITVGATHRKRPHEYGVSYFSSRGPTGDGRLKPDIVAPGEKVRGPTPNNRAEYKDGTSMAAPHVSGASALLMARHTELIAQPERIKRILCETATDLERERYFQGHGLVDILRALQSV
ncbi:S8 family serine peptidase [Pararhizobium sp. IMCC21322]|uniref:S8 family serine peptidase n=1 Tax=Pararhizobium sp. IMCC21322 TaxID=3067903 RepID=UPI0027408D05|nr:S8 family serine peptidase [Pararhizobium sp. IMCC21322]